jgi:hypothetical protein
MLTIPIPDPTNVINNIDEMYFRRKEWARQQRNDEAKRNAELIAEIQLLADVMNAYHDGYRQLCGELQDFRTNWTRQQRQDAAKDYRAWIDPRSIYVKISTQRTLLKERKRKDESLKQSIKEVLDAIISAADGYHRTTLTALLGRKESDDDRARLIDALAVGRSADAAQVVKDWVAYIRYGLDEGKHYLDYVTHQTATLRADLSIPDDLTKSPTRRRPWNNDVFAPNP